MSRHHNPAGLKIIAALKLLTATILILSGIGAFHLMNKDIGEISKRILFALDLDPRNGYLNQLLGQVTNLTPNDFKKSASARLFMPRFM